MKHEESKLQAEIVKLLQEKKIFFFSVPNEAGGRSKIQQMQLVSMGLRSGASDMVIVLPGKVIFMEVKTPDGKQSPAQERFEARVKELGHEYIVVRNLIDVEKSIDSIG